MGSFAVQFFFSILVKALTRDICVKLFYLGQWFRGKFDLMNTFTDETKDNTRQTPHKDTHKSSPLS